MKKDSYEKANFAQPKNTRPSKDRKLMSGEKLCFLLVALLFVSFVMSALFDAFGIERGSHVDSFFMLSSPKTQTK